MAKKGGSKLQRNEAVAIAEKLDAEYKKGGKHIRALIRFEETLIATFGISRGRGSGHGHIPRQLYITLSQAVELASCALSRDEYIDILRGKGVLNAEE